ncbi:MAG: HAD family phosphatase [Candidatus Lokiarchaeota archaeon]|nr:HAD family phosphatase [Candidatus Lokiarchaeota archaeon]
MSSQKDIEKSKIYGEKQKVRLYNLKHFIFDFGGVLIEKTFVLKNLFDMLEADLNFTIPRFENSFIRKIKRSLSSGRISSHEFLEKIFEKYYYPFQKTNGALPPKKVNVEYYVELWFDLYSQVTTFSLVMAEIIERLHQAGYTVSLLSNTHDIHAKSNMLKGFYDNFDNVFLSNEIGLIKPDMEKYKYVIKKLDTSPKKCVFIDDKILNLVPARELGMIVIRFESFERFKKTLNELGIGNINKNLRHDIKEKYKKYKKSKKKYKKVKKEYKKAKKEYLKKKGKSLKRKLAFQRKRVQYKKVKSEYKREREIKKDELMSNIKVS